MTQRAGRRSDPGFPHPRHEGSSKLTSLSLTPHNFTSAGEYLQPLKGLSEAMQANTSLARSGRLIMGKPLPHYHLHHAHHHCSPRGGPSGPSRAGRRQELPYDAVVITHSVPPITGPSPPPGAVLSARCAISQVTSLGDLCAHQTKVKASRIKNTSSRPTQEPAPGATLRLSCHPSPGGA